MKTSASDLSNVPAIVWSGDQTAGSSFTRLSNAGVPITRSSQSDKTNAWSLVSLIVSPSSATREGYWTLCGQRHVKV